MGAFQGGLGSDGPLADGTDTSNLTSELSKELLGGAPLGFPLKALYKRSCLAVGRWNHSHNKPVKRAGVRGWLGGYFSTAFFDILLFPSLMHVRCRISF